MLFPASTQYHICMAKGDLIRCNYFIDSFSGPYHCSFPSIKHMPGWIMRSHTEGFLLRQKPPWCMFVSGSLSSSSELLFFPTSLQSASTFLLLLFHLCVQAHKPSRPSGLSPATWLCRREPQLCWSAMCCGPRGRCSGWKTASSWDLRGVCPVFRATAWLGAPREVNRHRIRSTLYQT